MTYNIYFFADQCGAGQHTKNGRGGGGGRKGWYPHSFLFRSGLSNALLLNKIWHTHMYVVGVVIRNTVFRWSRRIRRGGGWVQTPPPPPFGYVNFFFFFFFAYHPGGRSGRRTVPLPNNVNDVKNCKEKKNVSESPPPPPPPPLSDFFRPGAASRNLLSKTTPFKKSCVR